MDTDRYFNLQLTIQKLEEELSLYRNGTTGQELLDLIKEKDSELGSTKAELNKKSEELATLMNNFSTLIKSSRKTLADNEAMKAQLQDLSAAHSRLTSQHDETSAALAAATQTMRNTQEALETTSKQLSAATQQNDTDAAMIAKLQEQGIGYVKKLNSQYSQIKDDEKKIKILENKLQCVEIETWKDKEKITELQLEYREQSQAYLKDKTAHTETITVAHRQLFGKVKEAEALGATVAELRAALEEQQAAARSAAMQRDDCARELQRQAEQAERNHEQVVQASKHAIESREEHWRNEAARLQKLSESDSARIKKFEAERGSLAVFKRDVETLRARNQELEGRLQRQEQQLRTRLLRDRGNVNNVATLGAPEASAKQPQPARGVSRGLVNQL